MITLELTPNEIASLSLLGEGEQIEVEYHGLPCFIVYTGSIGDYEINGRFYCLGFFNPPEWKIKESKPVIVEVHFHFLHEQTKIRRFKTYRCCVKEAIARVIHSVPDLSGCTDYRYTLTDEEGRLVK